MKIIRLFLLLLTIVSTYAVSDPTKPEETSPCVSNDPLLGDSAAWAVGALNLFNEKNIQKSSNMWIVVLEYGAQKPVKSKK